MKKVVVGISVVDHAAMRRLSRVYAGVDSSPFVLTFNYDEVLPEGELFLGDILITNDFGDYDSGEISRWLEHGFRNLIHNHVLP